ncbi:D site-binding protein isoform X2 [Grus americana]|uniref:D site-binding protein isoform X2 n=1 Tax=Grus americana TaxID=9117 RepID=UPI0024087EC8|nr:D site-binding protein isoform X2 [Grus americana]
MTAGPAPRAPIGRDGRQEAGPGREREAPPFWGGGGATPAAGAEIGWGNKPKGANEESATCAYGAWPGPAKQRPAARWAGRRAWPAGRAGGDRRGGGGAWPALATPFWGGAAPPRAAHAEGTAGRGAAGWRRRAGAVGPSWAPPPPPWERPGAAGELEYVDLDEFLREHGLPPSPEPPPTHERPAAPGPPRGPPTPPAPGSPLLETEALGGAGGGPFDPRRLRFSQDELRPQPIARKARKVHVPEEQKDEKYWSRRSKNNAAAKRSRDARRLKENQISVRAAFLERENAALRQEVAAARRELARFRALLARYEARHGAL